MNFPENEKTVGFLVTEATSPDELEQMQRVISRMCADRVVVFSMQPFDVQTATFWPTLSELFDGLTKHFVVQSVTDEDMARLASKSRSGNISLLLPSIAGS
jgi:hypothetical protein